MSGGELLDLRAKIDEMTDAWLTVLQKQTAMQQELKKVGA